MPTRFETRTVNLALSILRAELPLHERKARGTLPIRLALRVLYPRIARPDLFADFWREADIELKHPWMSGHREYRVIVTELRDAGWEIDPENEPG